MRKKIYYFLISICTFVISYFISASYVYGDQIVYRNLYDTLGSAPFIDSFYTQALLVSGGEPITATIIWIGAAVFKVDKDIYMSILNTILVLGVARFFEKHKIPKYYVIFVLTNFYFLVLFTAAERLKIGFIFLFWALTFTLEKHRFIFYLTSIFGHFQMLTILPIITVRYFIQSRNLLFNYVAANPFKFLALVLIVLFSMYNFHGSQIAISILGKLPESSVGITSDDIIKFLLLIAPLAIVKKNRFLNLASISVFIPLLFLLGSTRLNMMIFFCVCYILIIQHKFTNNFFIMLLLIYLSVKGFYFTHDVVYTGTGFHNVER